jgi:pyruvate dehydrogenase E1 component beta subunit
MESIEVATHIYEETLDYADAPIRQVAQKVPLPYNWTLEQMALPWVEELS